MDPDFAAGLQVTGLGMGLVFLTLILIMLIIKVLDRLFRAPAETEEDAAPLVGSPAVVTTAPVADASDEVAAIAVAIALARAMTARAPEPEFDYGNITGEIISVIRVEPGPSNWSRQGRLSATS